MIFMTQEGKTPVIILQELMAMLTTRKEAAEKILAASPEPEAAASLSQCVAQSDQFLAALLSELTEFGDAVMGEVDRENEYQDLWREAMKKTGEPGAAELTTVFGSMEDKLVQSYNEISRDGIELPASLQKLLQTQAKELHQK